MGSISSLDYIDFSTLIFRKDLEEYNHFREWRGKSSELRKKFIHPEVVVKDGVRYMNYKGKLLKECEVAKAFEKSFKITKSRLERGYDIKKITKEDGFYYLGCFKEDEENCEFAYNDFYNGVSSELDKRIVMSEENTIIDMYENGSIVQDLQTNSTYYYSNEDIEFFQILREFPFDWETAAMRNEGILKRKKYMYDIIDGLEENRMSDNFRIVVYNQKILNQFKLGYTVSGKKRDTGRCDFRVCIWYFGNVYGKRHYTDGRHCDNEVEAVCEAYKIEQSATGSDNQYLFNPIYFHRNQKHLLEQYIKGEITELGLIRQTLAYTAKNPVLILRYNLVDACRKYCVKISPFSLDEEGYMVNFNGTRYSDLAKSMSGENYQGKRLKISVFCRFKV